MTNFKNTIVLISSLPLLLSSAKVNIKNLDNDQDVSTYNHYLMTKYIPEDYVKFHDFDINMNNFQGLERGSIFVPFYKLDKNMDLYYEFYFIDPEGIRHNILSGVHTKVQSASLPSSGLYSVTGYFNLEDVGERSTFTFRFYDLSNRYSEHKISYFLSAPITIYHTGRYARIFYRVILSNGEIWNYEDRLDFELIAHTYNCEYYLKIPISSFEVVNYTLQNNFCDAVYFMVYDKWGYIDPMFNGYYSDTEYVRVDANLVQVGSSKRRNTFSLNETYYVNQDTFVASRVRGEGEVFETKDLYLPIQKYELYKTLPCAFYFLNFGRSKTTIIHKFDIEFEKKYIYSTVNVSRETGSYFNPKMEEHIIWPLD